MSDFEAKLWIGEEKEGDVTKKTLFVDNATKDDILDAVREYDVSRVYFGHEVNWGAIRKLENKVHVVVEVDDVSKVPPSWRGKVEVILRTPSWVSAYKQVDGDEVRVYESCVHNRWDGRKVYDDDNVIL